MTDSNFPDRRDLHFATLDDLLADAETIGLEGTGNWSAAQAIDHVRRVITYSREGGAMKIPFLMRMLGRLIKGSSIAKPMKAGFKIPRAAAAYFDPADNITLDAALEGLRQEVALSRAAGAMGQASPFFGPMSHDDWTGLHCRHAEMHFSFFCPAPTSD